MFDFQPPAGPKGIRPKEGSGDIRFYAPNRDLANLGVPLLKQALLHFETLPHPDPMYAAVLSPIPAEHQMACVSQVARDLATVVRNVMRDPTEQGPRLDAAVAKYMECRVPHQPEGWQRAAMAALLLRYGEVTLGATFAAICDVTPLHGEPPCDRSLAGVLAAADRLGQIGASSGE